MKLTTEKWLIVDKQCFINQQDSEIMTKLFHKLLGQLS